jgi:hypothetical protein
MAHRGRHPYIFPEGHNAIAAFCFGPAPARAVRSGPVLPPEDARRAWESAHRAKGYEAEETRRASHRPSAGLGPQDRMGVARRELFRSGDPAGDRGAFQFWDERTERLRRREWKSSGRGAAGTPWTLRTRWRTPRCTCCGTCCAAARAPAVSTKSPGFCEHHSGDDAILESLARATRARTAASGSHRVSIGPRVVRLRTGSGGGRGSVQPARAGSGMVRGVRFLASRVRSFIPTKTSCGCTWPCSIPHATNWRWSGGGCFPAASGAGGRRLASRSEQLTIARRLLKYARTARFLAGRAVFHTRAFAALLSSGVRWRMRSSGLSGGYWLFLGASSFFVLGMFIYVLLYNLYLLDLGFREDFVGQVPAHRRRVWWRPFCRPRPWRAVGDWAGCCGCRLRGGRDLGDAGAGRRTACRCWRWPC